MSNPTRVEERRRLPGLAIAGIVLMALGAVGAVAQDAEASGSAPSSEVGR